MWKLCYRKDRGAMRPIRGCPENFRGSLTTPTATIPKTFHWLLFRSTLWMFLQNLKSVALSFPEIIGVPKKFGQPLDTPTLHFLQTFLTGFYSEWPCKYRVFHKKNIRFIFSSFLTQMLTNFNNSFTAFTPMNCRKNWNKIYLFTWNLLPHYLAKIECSVTELFIHIRVKISQLSIRLSPWSMTRKWCGCRVFNV